MTRRTNFCNFVFNLIKVDAGVVNIIFPPTKKAEFLVKKYVSLKVGADQVEKIIDKHIPDGSSSIVFNFSGSNISLLNDQVLLPRCFLTFPHLGYVQLVTVPPAETFIVVCKTSVVARLFKLSLLQLIPPAYIDTKNILSDNLWQKMKEESVNEKRIEIFEDFLDLLTNRKQYISDKIDEAYEKIYCSSGLLSIENLASILSMNIRTLRRNFKRRTGLCPKSFSRIVRFNYLWKSFASAGRMDFQDLVFSGGFFDQAHFIHDFETFTGESPYSFFSRDLEKVKLLSGFK